MKTTPVALLLLVLLLSMQSFAQAVSETDYIDQTIFPATVLLYGQDESGDMKMRCTATAVEKTAKGYLFLSAAHCVGQDNIIDHRVEPDKTFFYITSDNPGAKDFLRATLLMVGYQHRGDDYSVLEVETTATFPIVAIGNDPSSRSGEAIVNVASPLGLGRQVFRGYVASPKLDRSVVENDINWTEAIMLQLAGVNGGSSGSAVICLNQRAICGFIVGTIGGTSTIAVPVSRYKTFRKTVESGKYKWYDPNNIEGASNR